jgi:hypothetical protein
MESGEVYHQPRPGTSETGRNAAQSGVFRIKLIHYYP